MGVKTHLKLYILKAMRSLEGSRYIFKVTYYDYELCDTLWGGYHQISYILCQIAK